MLLFIQGHKIFCLKTARLWTKGLLEFHKTTDFIKGEYLHTFSVMETVRDRTNSKTQC